MLVLVDLATLVLTAYVLNQVHILTLHAMELHHGAMSTPLVKPSRDLRRAIIQESGTAVWGCVVVTAGRHLFSFWATRLCVSDPQTVIWGAYVLWDVASALVLCPIPISLYAILGAAWYMRMHACMLGPCA